MSKPENPFRYRSMTWALMEEDWSDLYIWQIAEVFDTTPESVYQAVKRIHSATGYKVPYRGRPSERGPI